MPTAYTTRPVLNFDAPEPAITNDANASALFPAQPVYARTPKKKASNNLPLLIGAPVVAVAAGALIWGMMANRSEAPTDQQSLQVAAADSPAPLTAPLPPEATPSPIPRPTELAANETTAPAPVARAETPRAATPARPAARRAAPVEATAPDASSASSNVSATVPAAPPTVSAAPAPAIAEPAPLVVPSPAAPQPVAVPAEPTNPM
jgi:cytoskeletal protein RodZ